MPPTPKSDTATQPGDVRVKLRLAVYDALAATKGARSVVAQAALHGIGRQHMSGLRSGNKQPSALLAMRMAADLGTTVEVLFERKQEAA